MKNKKFKFLYSNPSRKRLYYDEAKAVLKLRRDKSKNIIPQIKKKILFSCSL